MAKAEDLTGQKFGRLTVLERVPSYIIPQGYKKSKWKCRCDCGNEKIILGNNLKSGHTKSCGCLKKEDSLKKLDIIHSKKSSNKKYNIYDLSKGYGIGYTFNTDNDGNNKFYFDLEDYDIIKDYYWSFNEKGYVIARGSKITQDSGKYLRLHILVMKKTNNTHVIDHINHKKYDNRKSNLRIVTQSQNLMNKKAKGVSWNKNRNKYYAYININHKRINLGSYNNYKDAKNARIEAEKKYYGEYRYQETI